MKCIANQWHSTAVRQPLPVFKKVSLILLFSFLTVTAFSSHFRFGNITWTNKTGNTVVFNVSQSWRMSAFAGVTLGGSLYIGNEAIFDYGDGSFDYLTLTVTSINTDEDWFYATGSVTHTYTAKGSYKAGWISCCRISSLTNNADGDFNIKTLVNVGSGNSSPVSTIIPIVDLPANDAGAAFTLPASEPNGQPMKFRLATSEEASGFAGYVHPDGLTVNANSGLVKFPTTGLTIGGLYTTQIIVSDGNGAEIPVDFIVRLSGTPGTAPKFDYAVTPADGGTINAFPGSPLSFKIKALDADAGDKVTLSAAGVPVGAVTSPVLPFTGNPVTTTFKWTPTTTDVGTYVVIFNATDNTGRSVTTSVTINVTNNNTCNLTLRAKLTDVTCYNSKNGSIDLSVSGGAAPYSYAWSNGTTTQDLSGIGAGDYTVKVTDKNKCAADSTFTITQPTAIAATAKVTHVSCKGGDGSIQLSATGGTPPYTYTLDGSSNSTGLFKQLDAGSYSYSVTDKNKCSVSGTATVKQADAIKVTVKVTNESCKGQDGAVSLSASGGTKPYTYMLGGKTNNNGLFTGLDAGTYNYSVTDASGCKENGSVSIKGAAALKVRISVSGCTYGFWGSYLLFLTDKNPNPKVKLTAHASGGSGSYWYDWGKAGKTATVTVSPQRNTYYTVTVTDKAGCKVKCKVTIFVIDLRWPKNGSERIGTSPIVANERVYSSEDSFDEYLLSRDAKNDPFGNPSSRPFRLYPNPASTYIVVDNGNAKLSAATDQEVEVVNMQGQLILKKKLNANLNRIDVSGLPSGLYLLNVKARGVIVSSGKFTVIR